MDLVAARGAHVHLGEIRELGEALAKLLRGVDPDAPREEDLHIGASVSLARPLPSSSLELSGCSA